MKIAAYYARVSTSRQENEETIENQIMAVKEFAKEKGLIIAKEYLDEGWSGTILARPALDELRIDAHKKIWEAVIIYDPDRLARKYSYQELVTDELTEAGIQVLFVTIPPPENDTDRLLYGVKGLFAEYERTRIAERFRLGKVRKARMGKYVNLQAPYGYDYIPIAKDQDAGLVIKEEEAEVIRKVFHWIADEGLTIRAVIKRLYELKVYPKKRKRLVWGSGPIGRLIRNESYIGKSYFNKNYAVVPENPKNNDHYKKVKKSSRRLRPKEEWIIIPVPPILDDDLFYRVQQKLRLNKKYNRRNRKTKCLLPQKEFCICGHPRNIEGVREHRYYRCTDRIYRAPLPRQCNASGVNAFHLDDMVWDNVLRLFTNSELIKAQARRWADSKVKEVEYSEDDIASNAKLLKKLGEEEQRYIKAYGLGALTLDQFQERMKEVRERKEVLQGEIGKISEQKAKPALDLSLIDNLPQKFSGMLQLLEFEEKQLFLRDVLEKVVVGDGTKVAVKGIIPVESEVQNNGLWTEYRHCGVAECGEIDIV